MTTAFFVGLGFIGGTVFSHLRAARPDLNIKVLVRKDEQAAKLRELGVEPVRGTLDDVDTIKAVAADPHVDIVFHIATADHVPSAQAIAEGLRARPKGSRKAIYIHTSGTGELVDDSHGNVTASEEYTFHDATAAGLDDRLKPSAPHRDVDLKLRELIANAQAEKEFNVRAAIILPPLIYGIGSGPFNQISIQIPSYIAADLALGHGVYVGGGKGVWNAIHVQVLATAYLAVLAHLEATEPGAEDNPYFIAQTQGTLLTRVPAAQRVVLTTLHHPSFGQSPDLSSVFRWADLTRTIAAKLHALGAIPTAQVSSIKDDEWPKFPVPDPDAAWGSFADNSLGRSEHLAAIGWKPDTSFPPVLQSVADVEVEDYLKRHNIKY